MNNELTKNNKNKRENEMIKKETMKNELKIDFTGINEFNEFDREVDFTNPIDIIMSDNGEGFCSMIKELWSLNDKNNIDSLKNENSFNTTFKVKDEFWVKYDELFCLWFKENKIDEFIPSFYNYLYEGGE